MRAVFLSSAIWGLQELRDEIAEFLQCKGIMVVRSENPNFYQSSGEDRHDISLKRVRETPNFLLIVDRRSGSPYRGSRTEYNGLTVTHAETREAFDKKTGWDCFVRHEVLTSYAVWKHNNRRDDVLFDSIDREVFQLLDDIDSRNKSFQVFDNLKDLKRGLSGLSWVKKEGWLRAILRRAKGSC